MFGVVRVSFRLVLVLAGVTCGFAPARGQTIDWEVANRFAPFEVLPDPLKAFSDFSMREGEGAKQWFARLAARDGGVRSPYAVALSSSPPAFDRLPWDKRTESHHPALLRFVRKEREDSTTVQVRLSVEEGGPCTWMVGNRNIDSDDCAVETLARIPLSGTTIAVIGQSFRSLSAALEPDHTVIVAIGDSYASGQGNPDVPTEWDPGFEPYENSTLWVGFERFREKRWSHRDNAVPVRRNSPAWLDDRCSRSFFSFQTLTALSIASRNKHAFVSYLHYACSGAEIFDGLLSPQYISGLNNERMQINAAIRDLCAGEPREEIDYTPEILGGLTLSEIPRANQVFKNALTRHNVLLCPEAAFRSPDLVHISIGGNDIGFEGIVRYYLVPTEYRAFGRTLSSALLPDVCPRKGNQQNRDRFTDPKRHCDKKFEELGYNAYELINGSSGRHTGKPLASLDSLLKTLFRVVDRGFRFEGDQPRILYQNYPDPLRVIPGRKHEYREANLTSFDGHVFWGETTDTPYQGSAWNGLKSLATALGYDGRDLIASWKFSLLTSEAPLLHRQFEEARIAIRRTVSEYNASAARPVQFVDATSDAFWGHGWWRGTQRTFPSMAHSVTSVAPWPPHEWRPYAYEADGRAVRTGNDSVLTQSPRPDDMDGGARAGYRGTAHPNLLGHALIADTILREFQLPERAR